MARKRKFFETPAYWKDIKKHDRFLEKINKAIDKKYWKDVKELIGEYKSRKIRKSDWL